MLRSTTAGARLPTRNPGVTRSVAVATARPLPLEDAPVGAPGEEEPRDAPGREVEDVHEHARPRKHAQRRAATELDPVPQRGELGDRLQPPGELADREERAGEQEHRDP